MSAWANENRLILAQRKADYVQAVKENQVHLYEDIQHLFELYLKEPNPLQYVDGYAKTVDKDHGRIEIRECWTLSATFHQRSIRNAQDWEKLTSLVCIRRERRLPQKTQIKTRYYIASREPNANAQLQAIRDHWGIENSVHWVLAVAFLDFFLVNIRDILNRRPHGWKKEPSVRSPVK